ncbi:hypothetical protein GGI42DRAFT_337212, partial [Trichoderma sp. SZMC 28013]
MYKRKFEDDLTARKRARTDNLNAALNHRKNTNQAAPTTLLTPIGPELLKKRKRSDECEAEGSRDREARRIKSSHGGSRLLTYPHSLSPASKYQIFSKTEDSSEEESQILGLGGYWKGRRAARSLTPDDDSASASDTTITIDVVLPIRLAKLQRHSPPFTSLPKKKKKQSVKQQKQQLLKERRQYLLKQQKLEQQKLKQQRLEQQKLEQQRLRQQKLEQQRLRQQKLEQQRLRQQKQPSFYRLDDPDHPWMTI